MTMTNSERRRSDGAKLEPMPRLILRILNRAGIALWFRDFEAVVIRNELSEDPKMEIRTSDGVELSFDIAGADPPWFLFVHGGGADRSHLAPQFQFFSQRNRSINLDLRGYGKSGRSEKYGTIEQYAEDLADLCNQLNIQKAIIIGHSMGGMVAIEFAAKYPSLSKAAVLISSGVLFPRAALADEANVLEGVRSPAYKEALCGLINQICSN